KPIIQEGQIITPQPGPVADNSQGFAQMAAELNSSASAASPYALLAEELKKELSITGQTQLPSQPPMNASLDIKVSDTRVTVTTRDKAPGLTVSVDNGPSLMTS
ncbi:hypothetical protein ACV1DN_20955, partial [Aeromonas allosaccharophila]